MDAEREVSLGPSGTVPNPAVRRGLARERGEHGLRHVLREVRIAADLPQRDRVNQIEMPPHEFGEGRLGFFLGVAAEQFGVLVLSSVSYPLSSECGFFFRHGGRSHHSRRRREIRTKKSARQLRFRKPSSLSNAAMKYSCE